MCGIAPDDVAQIALTCARDAVNRLIALVGSPEPWTDDRAEPELALITLTRRDENNQSKREVWEGHAALDLLMAAREVLAPVRAEPHSQ